jgi:hypothetical protein
MRAIFISYRREDAEGQAGRLFDDLTAHFGEDSVFMDVAGIAPGRDFRRVIDEHVASCGVLLAVIGKGWIDATNETGVRRLEDPADFVRLETVSALKRDIPVIPVLVHGARMPRSEQLPQDLAELAYRNGVELTHARWESDVQVLIKALSPYVESLQKKVGDANDVAAKQSSTAPASDTPAAAGTPSKSESALIPAFADTRKSLATTIAAVTAMLVIGGGGYLWYQVSSERAQMLRHAALLEEAKQKVAAEELKAKQRADEKAMTEALEAKKQAADKALAAEVDAKWRTQERDLEARRQAQEKEYARELHAKRQDQERADVERREAEKRAQEAALAERRASERQAREQALAEEREKMRIAQERAATQRARWPSYNFPRPNGGLLVYTIRPDGNPACASYDGSGCLWGVKYDQLDFRRMRPLACGPEHRARWGTTGYEDPKHWCSLARSMAAYRR